MRSERSTNGQFAPGNPGGPGRPRRAVEREYLAVLADTVPLDTWRAICQSAVEAAKNGDAKARDWLARYLIGNSPANLMTLAAEEHAGITVEKEIEKTLTRRARHEAIEAMLM